MARIDDLTLPAELDVNPAYLIQSADEGVAEPIVLGQHIVTNMLHLGGSPDRGQTRGQCIRVVSDHPRGTEAIGVGSKKFKPKNPHEAHTLLSPKTSEVIHMNGGKLITSIRAGIHNHAALQIVSAYSPRPIIFVTREVLRRLFPELEGKVAHPLRAKKENLPFGTISCDFPELVERLKSSAQKNYVIAL